METLWHTASICAKVHKAIELPFWVDSGMGAGIGVLDGGSYPQGEGEVLGLSLDHWFNGLS